MEFLVKPDEVEALARRLCEANGDNPDCVGYQVEPHRIGTPNGTLLCFGSIEPVPLWRTYMSMASSLLAQDFLAKQPNSNSGELIA